MSTKDNSPHICKWLEEFLKTPQEEQDVEFWIQEYTNILFLFSTLRLPAVTATLLRIDQEWKQHHSALHQACIQNGSATYARFRNQQPTTTSSASSLCCKFQGWNHATTQLTLASLAGANEIPEQFLAMWRTQQGNAGNMTRDKIYFVTHWILCMMYWRPDTKLAHLEIHGLAKWMDCVSPKKFQWTGTGRQHWLEPALEWYTARCLLQPILPLPDATKSVMRQLSVYLNEVDQDELARRIARLSPRRNVKHIRYHTYFLSLQYQQLLLNTAL